MKLRHVLGFALGIAQVSRASNATIEPLNGWYPCADFTFSDVGTSSGQKAECAMYTAPLCYPGICDSGNSKIDIFVKRKPAVGVDPEAATNVWVLTGGPGRGSSSRDPLLVDLHAKLNGTANIYTMDYRGTGRTTLLDCVAAQAQTTGSIKGWDIAPTEVAACAKALSFKYSDFAAFSITSAATDLVTFMSKHGNGANTIVYGVSYGTAIAQRLMHLDPPKVIGYVMDGIVSMSGVTKYFSQYENDFDEVSGSFLAFCGKDSECNSHFAKKSLADTLKDLIKQFDEYPNSTCASLVSNKASWNNDTASFKLKEALGSLFDDEDRRRLIAPIVYRLDRCSSDDIDVLTRFFDIFTYDDGSGDTYTSNILYFLIVFSEMWEIPGPSVAEMTARFARTTLSDGAIYSFPAVYCAFSKENSTWCNELGVGNYETNAIMYERDQYWGKSPSIPSQASVLLMSSKLDAITPHKYAENVLETLEGNNKELITFNYSTHGTLWGTFFGNNEYSNDTCGMRLLLSYINNDGDLQRLDKSCLSDLPPLNLTTPISYQHNYLGTDDAYDGAYDANLK